VGKIRTHTLSSTILSANSARYDYVDTHDRAR